MRIFLLAVLFLGGMNCALAQNNQTVSEKDFADKPLWIAMLNDTNANFFVVEKAFNTYFEHHELPEGEHEDIGEYSERKKKLSGRQLEKLRRDDEMRMHVKKYEVWRRFMLPYVQDDGRIMTPTERLEVWRSQKGK